MDVCRFVCMCVCFSLQWQVTVNPAVSHEQLFNQIDIVNQMAQHGWLVHLVFPVLCVTLDSTNQLELNVGIPFAIFNDLFYYCHMRTFYPLIHCELD